MNTSRWLQIQKRLAAPHLSVAVALGTLSGWLLLAQAWYLARVVDAVIFQQADLAQITPWLWIMLALMLLRAVLVWAVEQAAFRSALALKLALREQLVAHVQALGPVYLQGERSGDLAATLIDGVEALEAYYARYLPAVSLAVLLPLSILVFVFPVDWWSALIMLGTAPLIPLFMILIGKGAETLHQRQWRQLARMGAHFLDRIQGLTTLKLFGASRREIQTIAKISDDYRRSTLSVLRVAFLSSMALEFFATISVAVVAVLAGFRLYWGELDFHSGFFVLLLAPEFYLPLRNLGTHYHARMEAIGASERLIQVLETKVTPRSQTSVELPCDAPLSMRLESVHFAYEPGRRALEGVTLEIRAGEQVALVGPSGSGKTTLLQILLGFLPPDEGRVLVNGVCLTSIEPGYWRRRLAWIPQSPRLFQGSLLDNICLGQPKLETAAVETAARRARADEFIERLPAGYATRVGEGGVGLSAGQMQRIALARAFLKDAPLVLLDEATASLDLENEALVQEAIDELAKERTLVAVAHRLATVRRADRILVMDAGRLVESGSHEQLHEARGLYWQMLTAYTGGV